MFKFYRFICSALLVSVSIGAHAANEIKPVSASVAMVSTQYGPPVQNVGFQVRVANIAPVKQVYAHMKRWDGVWVDVPLSYKGPADAGYEIWQGSSGGPAYTAWNVSYALKYVVNGQTYWDNNGGQNYQVVANSGMVLYNRVVYSGAVPEDSGAFNGFWPKVMVTVANLAYSKQVKLIYTTNNWATVQTSNCSWYKGPNSYNFEDWRCAFPNIMQTTDVKYYFSYTVNGTTYYDNNFGNNYQARIVRY